LFHKRTLREDHFRFFMIPGEFYDCMPLNFDALQSN